MATDAAMRGRTGAREEWRQAGLLPIAAGLGYATSVIHIYGLGPFIEPIQTEFGWSRSQVAGGLTLATLVQAVGGVFVGLAVDRFGPRRFGLPGILCICAAFALIATASGTSANWFFLWGVIALAALPVQASVWTAAVASRFTASRGLAFAVTLCGASVAGTVFPLMGSFLIEREGWRTAMPVMGAVWCAITLPVIFLFFRGATEVGAKADRPAAPKADLPGVTLREGLLSSIYWRLQIACLLFTFTILALVVHFVPILTDRGVEPVAAAGIASLVGAFSLIGRFGTGLLLDRFPASLVGAAVFLLPVGGCLLLIGGDGASFAVGAAAALVGLTLGAEIDVIAYLTSRHFGLRNFGGLYGGLLAALSIGTALGPLAAAWVYDTSGNYLPFLWATLVFMAGSSLALVTLPRGAPDWGAGQTLH
jgi:MFS family permease